MKSLKTLSMENVDILEGFYAEKLIDVGNDNEL